MSGGGASRRLCPGVCGPILDPGIRALGVIMGRRGLVATVAVLLSTSHFACNEVPVSHVLDGFVVQVEGSVANTGTVNLDILWVIDNSVSMCQEQNSLASNIDTFLNVFQGFNVDLRMGVVTTDGLSPAGNSLGINKSTLVGQGRFNTIPATAFVANCLERAYNVPCLEDAECAHLGEQWICEPPFNKDAGRLYNLNGPANSKCRYLCETDEECVLAFGSENAICFAPGGDWDARGCLVQPNTADCDDLAANHGLEELPMFVSTETDTLDLFHCIATVGASQAKNPQLEQGMNAAIWALDRSPPPGAPDNSAQASAFVRDDAYLIIVFVSDENDCSLSPGVDILVDDHSKCDCLEDTDHPTPSVPNTLWHLSNSKGPLLPVSTAANQLKALKEDSSRVLVASIVADVLVDGSGDDLTCAAGASEDELLQCVDEHVDSYYESKCTTHGIYAPATYVCNSTSGLGHHGSRYIELVSRFEDQGFAANICNNSGLEPALDDIATSILTKIVSFCLPHPRKPGEELLVIKTVVDPAAGDVEIPLVEGVDFTIEPNTCGPSGEQDRVFFSEVLGDNESVSFRYIAPLVATGQIP